MGSIFSILCGSIDAIRCGSFDFEHIKISSLTNSQSRWLLTDECMAPSLAFMLGALVLFLRLDGATPAATFSILLLALSMSSSGANSPTLLCSKSLLVQ